MQDIQNRKDIILLVDTFYGHVRKDTFIGPIFNERIGDRWPEHLEKMYNFWENILFGNNAYQGRPFPPHATMPIDKEHFEAWLGLFHGTVDSLFKGPIAEEAKSRAHTIASVFHHKITQIRESEYKNLL